MNRPSADDVKQAATTWTGAVPGAAGIVLAVSVAIELITSVRPLAGSNSRKSAVVATRAIPSMPNATPNGGFARAYTWRTPFDKSMTVMAFEGDKGGATLPKWVAT